MVKSFKKQTNLKEIYIFLFLSSTFIKNKYYIKNN